MIFRNEKGNPVCHYNFSKRQFIKDMETWGKEPKIRFHDLRHMAITLMIANNIGIKTVQSIAGHAASNCKLEFGDIRLSSESRRQFVANFLESGKADLKSELLTH